MGQFPLFSGNRGQGLLGCERASNVILAFSKGSRQEGISTAIRHIADGGQSCEILIVGSLM